MRRPLLTTLDAYPFSWVTPPELAKYLECDRRTILRMIDDKAIDAYRVGRNWRIPLVEARRVFHVQHTRRYTA